ncbi:hypothetical protein [Halosegnis rubeus]|mgnify:FL=1|jgi:hypothetical protein|uniref:hypothetical protein n=1 Tax=Halosegnis rubeus TaxID=2212850 RepID=UPI001561F369|nr:hypothetical protein [Halosegnis rubeus]
MPPQRAYTGELAPSTLIAAGAALIVFPEPATTTLGFGVLLLGLSWWVYEWN